MGLGWEEGLGGGGSTGLGPTKEPNEGAFRPFFLFTVYYK